MVIEHGRTGAGRRVPAGSGPVVPAYLKRAWGCPALGSFAHVTAPDRWLGLAEFIGSIILVFFHRQNAIKPDNRLLLLGYFLKTRDFAGRRPLSILEIFI